MTSLASGAPASLSLTPVVAAMPIPLEKDIPEVKLTLAPA